MQKTGKKKVRWYIRIRYKISRSCSTIGKTAQNREGGEREKRRDEKAKDKQDLIGQFLEILKNK